MKSPLHDPHVWSMLTRLCRWAMVPTSRTSPLDCEFTPCCVPVLVQGVLLVSHTSLCCPYLTPSTLPCAVTAGLPGFKSKARAWRHAVTSPTTTTTMTTAVASTLHLWETSMSASSRIQHQVIAPHTCGTRAKKCSAGNRAAPTSSPFLTSSFHHCDMVSHGQHPAIRLLQHRHQ